jgi:hypothetical protein
MSARLEATKCEVSTVTIEGYHHIHLSDAPAVAAVIREFLQRQRELPGGDGRVARSKL